MTDPILYETPTPIEASGDLDVHVGRIRRDLSNPNGVPPQAAEGESPMDDLRSVSDRETG